VNFNVAIVTISYDNNPAADNHNAINHNNQRLIGKLSKEHSLPPSVHTFTA